ncbi:MAG: DUF3237 domain-containing protein [Novosphingobium sp.]|nr:DUF3237 domain-containing protein [Novosphingobium sp.]
MIELIPLFTATYELTPPLEMGDGPAGTRVVGEIRSATIEGERIRASMAGTAAADWMVRTGAIALVDVRISLRTDDGALIYMQYGGRLDMANRANGLIAYVAPTFETGDERYAWLNAIQAVGKGVFTPSADGGKLEYEFCEVR